MKRRRWIAWGLVGLLPIVASAVWAYWPADMARWPRYEAFRCYGCNGPAAVDPDEPHRWGCPRCGFLTYRPARRFAVRKPKEFPTARAHWDAEKAAGAQDLRPGCPWAVYFGFNI